MPRFATIARTHRRTCARHSPLIPTASRNSRPPKATCCSTGRNARSMPRRWICLKGWRSRPTSPARRDAMFAGREDQHHRRPRGAAHGAARAARPVAGRSTATTSLPDIHAVLDAMAAFSDAVRSGAAPGATGKKITDVVNIGIGGSDLGPAMATLALAPWHDGPRAHFVSNVDGAHIHDTLKGLDPGDDAVHRRVEDLHHHRDHDQRRDGAALDRAGAGRRRGGQALRRGFHRARQGREIRHRAPIASSASGTGSAAAIRCGAPSACRS